MQTFKRYIHLYFKRANLVWSQLVTVNHFNSTVFAYGAVQKNIEIESGEKSGMITFKNVEGVVCPHSCALSKTEYGI